MRYPNFISGIFGLCIGLLLSLWSTCYQIGSFLQTGPGLLTLILGLLLILLSLILLGQAKKSFSAVQNLAPAIPPGGWKDGSRMNRAKIENDIAEDFQFHYGWGKLIL